MDKPIAIVDYGAGNIESVQNAFLVLEVPTAVLTSPADLREFKGLILPGVGSFSHAMGALKERGWDTALNESVRRGGAPFLGICLGFQLMMQSSPEGGHTAGLGWFDSRVELLKVPEPYCVPHVGWNSVEFDAKSRMFRGLQSGDAFYFTHSYHVPDSIFGAATCSSNAGVKIAAGLEIDNIWGTQFHPEKSQRCGLKLLRNFSNFCGERC